MTDIYIRRGGLPPPRPGRRWAGLALLLLLAAAAAWWIHHRRATRAPAPAPGPAAAPEGAPAGPVAAGAPGTVARPAPTPGVAPPAPGGPAPFVDVERAAALMQEAKKQAAGEDWGRARETCFQVLDLRAGGAMQRAAEDLLGTVHTRLLFAPHPMPEKQEHVVQSGESLGSLARKYRTNVELIRKANGIAGSVIRVGDRLRIPSGTFRIVVDLAANDLVVSLNGRFFKRYAVGTGKYEKTPTGLTKVTDRIAQPTWWRADGKAVAYGDPENVLGTHWLALDIRGFGIHGTWQPETVGRSESAGCVRLVNADIEELYTLIPVGTEVELVKPAKP